MSDTPTESGGAPITGDVIKESGGAPVYTIELDSPAPPSGAGVLSELTKAARSVLASVPSGSAVVIPSPDQHCWIRAARKLGKKVACRSIKGSNPAQMRLHII